MLQNPNNDVNPRDLIKEYENNAKLRRKEIITNNSKRFAELNNSQKLKQYKNHWKKLKIMEDEPFLMHNNNIVPKNEALRNHYSNICGNIIDPSIEENHKINEINEYYSEISDPTY